MSKFIDLIGQKFGRLTIVKYDGNDRHNKAVWLCQCDCGEKIIVVGSSLRSNHTRSCGCFRNEITIQRSMKHGHRRMIGSSRTYTSWRNMIDRCMNPKNKYYHNYGGRGIIVCQQWLKDFRNFLKDMGECPKGYSIDRINNSKNYCKSNCHWITAKMNNRNKRNNRLITFGEKTQCIAAWAEETGINEDTIRYRLNSGWLVEDILV